MIAPILSVQLSIPFNSLVGAGLKDVLVLNSNDVLHRSAHSSRSPPNCVHSIRSGLKSLVSTFSLRHALELSSYLKPLILAIITVQPGTLDI